MVDQRGIDDQRWLDSRAAAEHLGVQRRTLYAYVSRGQVRSMAGAEGRPRLYALDDLERLRARSDARAGHGAVAAGALRWGEAVLDSAITAITPHGPAYRGHLAVALADRGASFERVAELLWSGHLPAAPVAWPGPTMRLSGIGPLLPPDPRPLDVMSLLVPIAALDDPDRGDDRPDAVLARGRRLIPLLAAALAPGFTAAAAAHALRAGPVAAVAARALGLGDNAAPTIDRALVLLADHELNASSFTARVAASTHADPYACVAAALATLSGPRHGSAAEAVCRFADEVGSADDARAAVRALRREGGAPPGFGHPLYPSGDPRAAALLAALGRPADRRSRTLLAVVEAMAAPTRREGAHPAAAPTVDVALAVLVSSLGVAPSAASGIFAVARSAGWLAHALEQRAAGFLLRPRARYTGPPVG
jgi:citrate synthase